MENTHKGRSLASQFDIRVSMSSTFYPLSALMDDRANTRFRKSPRGGGGAGGREAHIFQPATSRVPSRAPTESFVRLSATGLCGPDLWEWPWADRQTSSGTFARHTLVAAPLHLARLPPRFDGLAEDGPPVLCAGVTVCKAPSRGLPRHPPRPMARRLGGRVAVSAPWRWPTPRATGGIA
ncbi:hypothetical protein LX36DRAFT_750227 [Colletotrichum falcatum]|nr:hypothetical protein LX36DRAFT_750227 [Colletotrichum falcatum]